MVRRRARTVSLASAGAAVALLYLAALAPPGAAQPGTPTGAGQPGAARPAVADDATFGHWQGPQVVDPTPGARTGSMTATIAGAFALWSRPRERGLVVARRAPGSSGLWSTPAPLPDWPRRADLGPILGLARQGAVAFATTSPLWRSSSWQISHEGEPSARESFPYRSFVPEAADVAGRRWLVAGTQNAGGTGYLAVRGPQGRWRISDPLPRPRWASFAGAWFDRAGRPHLMAVRHLSGTRADASAASPAGRTADRPILESILHRDGSWSTARLVARTPDDDSGMRPVVRSNADGDVAIMYSVENEGSVTADVRLRPYGGTWSDPVPFQASRTIALELDADGGAAVLQRPYRPDGEAGEVWFGRISPDGTLAEWRQVTDAAFTPDNAWLSMGRRGIAVVAVSGTRHDQDGATESLRTMRCEPGSACQLMGDFDETPYISGISTRPNGSTYLLAESGPPCTAAGLCSFFLPPPTAG